MCEALVVGAFLTSLLSGVSLGMIFFLIAIGLSLVIGLMGIINLSHGSLVMLGGYLGIFVAKSTGEIGLGILAAIGASGLVGLGIHRGFLRGLYRKDLEQILVTFGFVYIITNLHLWIYGPRPKAPFVPAVWGSSFAIGDFQLPIHRLAVIAIGLGIYFGLWWLFEKTKLGATIRAGMDDKEMTSGLGINLTPVTIRVFFIGTALAGLAGVIGALSLGGMSLEAGPTMLMVALSVTIVGGVGSIKGALVGALVIGIATALTTTYFPFLAMFIMYIAMIVVLVIKPSGLLGTK
ncbi:MAG: branched-chain amino acid ABC transporter permease [Dehalococcoidales bacterium]|nr:branched-chain amino acid ABC transporter permease [Dehalococcoidales bacterium]